MDNTILSFVIQNLSNEMLHWCDKKHSLCVSHFLLSNHVEPDWEKQSTQLEDMQSSTVGAT